MVICSESWEMLEIGAFKQMCVRRVSTAASFQDNEPVFRTNNSKNNNYHSQYTWYEGNFPGSSWDRQCIVGISWGAELLVHCSNLRIGTLQTVTWWPSVHYSGLFTHFLFSSTSSDKYRLKVPKIKSQVLQSSFTQTQGRCRSSYRRLSVKVGHFNTESGGTDLLSEPASCGR